MVLEDYLKKCKNVLEATHPFMNMDVIYPLFQWLENIK